LVPQALLPGVSLSDKTGRMGASCRWEIDLALFPAWVREVDAREGYGKPFGNMSVFGRHESSLTRPLGFSGIIWQSLSATWNACLFASWALDGFHLDDSSGLNYRRNQRSGDIQVRSIYFFRRAFVQKAVETEFAEAIVEPICGRQFWPHSTQTSCASRSRQHETNHVIRRVVLLITSVPAGRHAAHESNL